MYFSLVIAQQRWQRFWLWGLGVLTAGLFLLSLALGEYTLLPWQLDSALERTVFFDLRLPRALLALLVGAALACCGAVLQVLLHNPVAEPSLLGVSSGAGLTTMLAMALAKALGLYLPVWSMSLAALIGALLVTALLFRLARQGRLNHAQLLLFGMAVGILSNAAMTWLLYFSDDASLREFMFWMMGSLAYGSSQMSFWWLVMALLVLWLVCQGKVLQQLLLGETNARLMGLDVDKWHRRLVLAVCLLTAMAVSLCGVIGFVGLVVPHILRLCGGAHLRFLLPASALGGSALLLAADLLARTALTAGELPIGVITASVGAPMFIYLLLRQARHGV